MGFHSMDEFNPINQVAMIDAGFKGSVLTWTNNQDEGDRIW